MRHHTMPLYTGTTFFCFFLISYTDRINLLDTRAICYLEMEAIVYEITLNYIPTHLHHWHFFLSGMVSGRYCRVGQTGLHILPNAPSKPARASRMSSPWCSRRVHSYGMLMSHGSEQLFMALSSYIQKLAFLIPFHSLMKSTLLS